MSKGKIIFLSHTPRFSNYKVGSYHLSNYFRDKGYDILYISYSISPFHAANIVYSDRRRLLQKKVKHIWPVKEKGIINYVPISILNTSIIKSSTLIKYESNINIIPFRYVLNKIGFSKVDYVIQDSLHLNSYRKQINYSTLIYRATDDYINMPQGFPELEEIEREVVDNADLNIVTSDKLKQTYEKRYGGSFQTIINGVNYGHFNNVGDNTKTEDLKDLESPILIYVGIMDNRFDWSVIEKISRELTTGSIVLIGGGNINHNVTKRSNVKYLGEKSYDLIPAYMQNADFGLLPFVLSKENSTRSPMKMFEYAASGLPIISTKVRSFYNYKAKIKFIDNETNINEIINSVEYKIDEIKNSAKRYGWEKIGHKLEKLMTNL